MISVAPTTAPTCRDPNPLAVVIKKSSSTAAELKRPALNIWSILWVLYGSILLANTRKKSLRNKLKEESAAAIALCKRALGNISVVPAIGTADWAVVELLVSQKGVSSCKNQASLASTGLTHDSSTAKVNSPVARVSMTSQLQLSIST